MLTDANKLGSIVSFVSQTTMFQALPAVFFLGLVLNSNEHLLDCRVHLQNRGQKLAFGLLGTRGKVDLYRCRQRITLRFAVCAKIKHLREVVLARRKAYLANRLANDHGVADEAQAFVPCVHKHRRLDVRKVKGAVLASADRCNMRHVPDTEGQCFADKVVKVRTAVSRSGIDLVNVAHCIEDGDSNRSVENEL